MTTLIREANAAMITGLSIISSGSDQRGMVFAAMAATGEVQDGFMLSGNTRSFRRTVPSTLTKAQTLCLPKYRYFKQSPDHLKSTSF